MKVNLSLAASARRICSKGGPLLLILQKTPLAHLAVSEARVLGSAGVSQLTKWTVAAVAGLGSYDTVSGATVVQQVSPSAGSSSASATNGSTFALVMQVTGAPSTAGSWKLTGTLPAGLTHQNAKNSNTDSVSGRPTQNGNFSLTFTAYEKSGYSGGSKSKTISLSVTGGVTPPAFTTQPGSVSIAANTATTLSAAAAGAASYQWYTGNAGDTTQPVGTGPSYTTPALTVTTNYWVKATNGGGSVNSTVATVTVIQPPGITTQPASATITAGATTTLTVAASGDSPVYQWYQGSKGDTGQPVGTSMDSFTTPALTTATSYWVRVTNSAGTADSETAIITIDVPPGITTQPASTTINSGTTAVLSVVATGAPLQYQWYAGTAGDTAAPVGSDAASFTTPALTETTSYWVRVSNSAGTLDSETATVTVGASGSFESWSTTHFSAGQIGDPLISGPDADPDGDAMSNEAEYLFGTEPLMPETQPTLAISPGVDQASLSFSAVAAAGSGYTGLIRHYALDSAPSPSAAWIPVAGFEDIVAAGQTVTYSTPVGPNPVFHRMRVWLTDPARIGN